jgi:hypothetical protein
MTDNTAKIIDKFLNFTKTTFSLKVFELIQLLTKLKELLLEYNSYVACFRKSNIEINRGTKEICIKRSIHTCSKILTNHRILKKKFSKITEQMKDVKIIDKVLHSELEKECNKKLEELNVFEETVKERITIYEKKIEEHMLIGLQKNAVHELLIYLFRTNGMCIFQIDCNKQCCAKNHYGLDHYLNMVKQYYFILQPYTNNELIEIYQHKTDGNHLKFMF